MTIETISDQHYDDVIIFKLFSKPTLLKSLKRIENIEVFTAIEEFYVDELKVCTLYIFLKFNM